MKRFLAVSVMSLVAVVVTSDTASAQFPGNYGFLPWGFYQPYGAQYGTSIRTPPYFATNPPVYYGARHGRPGGPSPEEGSPFASPPLVSARGDYESRLRSRFLQPQVPTPEPLCNPYIHSSRVRSNSKVKLVSSKPAASKIGPVRTHPFVEPEARIAKVEQ